MNNSYIYINDDVCFDLKTSSFIFNNKLFASDVRNDIQHSIDFSIIQRRIARFTSPRVITALNLIPSMQCHGKCLYCYNEDNNNQIMDMLTIDTIQKNITLLNQKYKLNLKECRIYGGEPLLNVDIFDILEYLYNCFNVQIYMSSGLLFDNVYFVDILNKIEKLNFPISIGISLDLGCKTIYTRKNNYNITCNDLINRAKMINDITNSNVILVTTISKYTDIITLEKDINYCISNLPDVTLRFAIACDDKLYPSITQIDEICELLTQYVNNPNITNNIFPYYDIINSQHVVKINEDRYNIVFNDTSCGVFSNMINMLPNGELIHCHMNPYDTSTEIINFNTNKNMILNPECCDCEYWRVCRGGCYYRKQINIESTRSYCYWIKRSFELALKRLYAKNKNLKYLLNNINELSI